MFGEDQLKHTTDGGKCRLTVNIILKTVRTQAASNVMYGFNNVWRSNAYEEISTRIFTKFLIQNIFKLLLFI